MRAAAFALLIGTAAVVPSRLTAQAAERGAYVVRLGVDTLSAESFTRTRDRLEGVRAIRAPRAELERYTATLGPGGRITDFEAKTWAAAQLEGPPARSSRVGFSGDSAEVTIVVGDSTRTYRTAVRPGAVPVLNSVYALYEQMTRQAAAAGADSVPLDIIFAGALSAIPTYVRRTGPDSAVIGYFGFPLDARVDRAGRILGLDGARTTLKVVVTRQASFDVAALARAFALGESTAGPAGRLSPRDTTRATIGGTTVTVDYGRPRRRGRVVFGGVVPWGEIWRTGANAATGFTTDRDLMIGGTALPAGSYTLWTLPARDGATLIINRQIGQWGTDYEAAEDFARVPLQETRLPQPVEEFTIAIEATGPTAGVLTLRWDRTQWEVSLEASP